MIRGEAHPTIQVGEESSWAELGPLLKSRATILTKWAGDDSLWDSPLEDFRAELRFGGQVAGRHPFKYQIVQSTIEQFAINEIPCRRDACDP